MRLDNDSLRDLRAVFDAFTDADELVSRSQARRVAHRFERFKRVELDFGGVSEIGQGFADELFRVFAAAHPQIRIAATNTEPAVSQMIRRVVAAGVARSGPEATE